MKKNDFSITVASVNGSGTQTANNCLSRVLFRHGAFISAKNLFPSNISGLPTWFSIRTSAKGYVSREPLADIFIARNKETLEADLNKVKSGGLFLYDADWKIDLSEKKLDFKTLAIPFRELTEKLSESIRMRRLISNMVYVGILAECLELDSDVVTDTLRDLLPNNASVVDANASALLKGREYAKSIQLKEDFPYQIAKNMRPKEFSMFIDGNAASALGAVVGGCTVLAWYPITPASSLAENFQEMAEKLRPRQTQGYSQAVVQVEDELSAVSMAIGAGWAGARAMTSTSGPGLSLMAEAAGLSYFAEIPTVIWDVQRAGPSTGLPTRTLQGDLLSAYTLSHGDTEHILLIPSTPEECYEFAQLAFDLAEKFQTLVIVLSDLDLGMNFRMSREFALPAQGFQRGKVLSAEDLNKLPNFARYKDVDGDGVTYRTLPGTKHVNAAYFTRGTAHTETSAYSEDNENFKKLLDRLKLKLQKSVASLPTAAYSPQSGADTLFISYGSTHDTIQEVQDQLTTQNIKTSHLRIRSLPLPLELESILKKYKKVFVFEQNRDAQLKQILSAKFPRVAANLYSILSYDGLPPCASHFTAQILQEART